jgi:hypothetical protein
MLLSHFKERFVRNKLVKVVVDFAIHDFKNWNSYFDDVIQLMAVDPTIAMVLLKTTVEEFFDGRGITTNQSNVLRLGVNSKMPSIMEVVLFSLQNGVRALRGEGLLAVSPVSSSSPYPSPTHVVPQTVSEVLQNSKLAIECLQILISHGQNQDYFWTQQSIELILHYASISEDQYDWSMISLGVVDELFAKPTLSLGATAFLPKIMDAISFLLQQHVELFRRDELDHLPEGYTTKVIDIWDKIVSNHLESFSIMDHEKFVLLLSRMIDFTFVVSDSDDLPRILKLWSTLIETMKPIPVFDQVIFHLIDRLFQDQRFQEQGQFDVGNLVLDIVTVTSTMYPKDLYAFLIQKFQHCLQILELNPNKVASNELGMVCLGLGRMSMVSEEHLKEFFDTTFQVMNQLALLLQRSLDSNMRELFNQVCEALTLHQGWFLKTNSKVGGLVPMVVASVMKSVIQYPQKSNISSSKLLVQFSKPPFVVDVSEQVMSYLKWTQSVSLHEPIVFSNIWKFSTNQFIYHRGDEEERASQFKNFLMPVLEPLRDPTATAQHSICIQILNAICLATKEGNLQSRNIAFFALADVIPLLAKYLDLLNPNINATVALLTLLIDVFKKQLSKSENAFIVPQTLEWCQSYILYQSGNEDLEHLCFMMFDMLIEDKSKLFDSALPNMISFCISLHSHSINNNEKLGQLYQLIDRILYYHWNYFFPSRIQAQKGMPERPTEFLRLFEVMTF